MKNSLCLSMWIPWRHHALSCWYITPWHTNRILRENPHSPMLIFKLIIITYKTPLCNVKLIVAQTFSFFFKPPFFKPVYTYTSALIIISFLVEMGIMRVMFPVFPPPPPPPHNKQLNKPKHRDTCWYQYLFFQCIMQQQKKRDTQSPVARQTQSCFSWGDITSLMHPLNQGFHNYSSGTKYPEFDILKPVDRKKIGKSQYS